MPTTNEARAEARFREASDAFDHGRVDEACAAFADSLRLYATLGTLLNLALCHEKQGKTASAWTEFTHAAGWAGDAAQRDRREFARQHAQRLERTLTRVRIEVPPEPAAVSVAIDSDAAPEVARSLPLFLDPGEHTVAVSAPAFKTSVAHVSVPATSPSEAIVVAVPPLEAIPPPPPAVATPSPVVRDSPMRRNVGWVVGGAGIVSLGVGVAFGADAISRTSGLTSCAGACDSGPARTAEAISLTTLVVGAVAVGAGAWLVFSPSRAPSKAARVVVAPGRGGLTVAGVW